MMAEGQPLRAATGQGYGDRKATLDQQRGTPLAVAPDISGPATRGTSGAGSSGPSRPALPIDRAGIFGSTNRPDEPVTTGIDFGPGDGAEVDVLDPDPDYLLRAALAFAPSSRVIADLLARRAR